MITTNPVRVSSSMVTASSVAYPDTGESVWSSAVNYAAGATVSYSINGTFHRFESKQSGNLNHIPSAYPDDASNAWWIDLGYVNKLAAFQLERNTQTITTSPYTVSVDPGERVGCIGIGNIEADSVRLRVYNSSAVLLYDQTNTLLSRSVYDWYSWTYAPFQQLKNTLFNNLPLNSGNTFDLTFTKSSGSVKVGAIVPGMPLDIGRALMGNTGVRMINFSLFERDEFGEVKVTVRKNIPKVNYQLLIDAPRFNGVKRMINDLNGVVTMWAGITDADHPYFESVFTIGICKDFGNVIDLPNYIQADIEIEAL